MLEKIYNLATRYELLNGITLTWNNIFHIRLYAICSAEIWKTYLVTIVKFVCFLANTLRKK